MTQPTTTDWQPLHEWADGISNTVTGQRIDLRNPTPDMIVMYDVATGLCHECRFGGQLHHFYSVAMHTLLVLRLVQCAKLDANEKHRLCRAALVHDMSEAYLKDIPKPLKVILGEVYAQLEDAWMAAIRQKWDVTISDLEAVKPYDIRAVEIEHQVLRLQQPNTEEGKLWDLFLMNAGWFGRWPSRTDLRGRFMRICRNYGIE